MASSTDAFFAIVREGVAWGALTKEAPREVLALARMWTHASHLEALVYVTARPHIRRQFITWPAFARVTSVVVPALS